MYIGGEEVSNFYMSAKVSKENPVATKAPVGIYFTKASGHTFDMQMTRSEAGQFAQQIIDLK